MGRNGLVVAGLAAESKASAFARAAQLMMMRMPGEGEREVLADWG